MDTVSQAAAGHPELADELRRRGVKYAMGGWTDVLGRGKSKIVPAGRLPRLLAGSERGPALNRPGAPARWPR